MVDTNDRTDHSFPMAKELLTTREAAERLGVGTTSIKRWADSGVLECVKTPGGHRRFPREAVDAMLESEGDRASDRDQWVDLLLTSDDPQQIYRRLREEREDAGSWWKLCDALAPALVELGERWQSGAIGILEEHLASERLHRAVAHLCEDVQPPDGAPSALLVTAEGDEHTLGLGLVELVLRESGWNTSWSGRRTPYAAIRRFVSSGACELLAVSASSHSSDRELLAEQASRLGALCQQHQVHLLLGGEGPWPEELAYGHRIHSFEEQREVVRRLRPPAEDRRR